MLIIINFNIKTMKRRVNIKDSYSELVVVKDQYEVYIEEHLRVSNRNQKESRLRRVQSVSYWALSNYLIYNSVVNRVVILYDKLGGIAKT